LATASRLSLRSAVLLSALAAVSALTVPAAAQQQRPYQGKGATAQEPAQEPAPAAKPPAPAPVQAPAPPVAAHHGGFRIQGKASRNAHGGSFKVVYGAIQDEHFKEIQKIFRETQLLEETAKGLNDVFVLPTNVTITLTQCGEANAFYTPENKTVSLCYELIDQLSDMFLADAKSKEEQEDAGEAIAGATMFTLYHELGHALIDIYDLPVTGREEDAVDQLATILLVEGGDDGEAAALNGALSFLSDEEDSADDATDADDSAEVSEEEEEPADISYWDEHSLGEQRFYNIICWIYGKDPEGYEDLVTDGTLPQERAARCAEEYAKMTRSWDVLLSPKIKAD
jgi:hypothetical protein